MADEETVRAFLAVEIPEEIKRDLVEGLDRLRGELPSSRWTRPEGWHVTLKFLGAAEPARLVHLSSDLEERLRGGSEIPVHIHGTGFFPSRSQPRVAWIGGAAPGIERVVRAVESSTESFGFKAERRPWSIHLTIARIRKRWPKAAVERWLEWGESLDIPSFAFSEVVLFQSDLRPEGAVYTALERIPIE